MSPLSTDDVKHIAKLCRLAFNEEDLERFSSDLTNIVGYISQLEDVDTGDVPEMQQVVGLTNMTRDDAIVTNDTTSDELLECSPLPIVDHQIQTPSAHG